MSRRVDRRRFLKGASAVTATGLIAGCTSLSGGSGGSTLRVGVLMPETGDLGELGRPIRDGALLPARQLEGETEFTIDTQVGDTQTNPDAGESAANELVNAGYPAITGAASSGVSLQVYRNVLIPNGVVGISPASTSPAITDLDDNDLIYRTPPTDALQGEVLARVGRERIGADSASTMFVNNSYGQLLSESFVNAFENMGGSIAATVGFQKEQSSYTSRIEQALADDPGMMVVIGYPASGNQLFRDFYSDFGQPDLPILVTDGLRAPKLPQNVGNAMANVQGTAPLAAGPGTEFFNEQYQSEFGNEPGVFTSQAYDATAVNLLAAAAAETQSGSAIADQIRPVANAGGEEFTPSQLPEAIEAAAAGNEMQYSGASSAVEFDENGDMTAVTYELFGFQEGGGVETIDEINFGG